MSKFQITSFAVKTVPDGKINKGNEYVTCDLLDMDDPFNAHVPTLTFFTKNIIPMFKQAGTADKLPDSLKFIYGVFKNQPHPSGRLFTKKYLSDGVRRNGTAYKAGETVVDSDGQVRLFGTIPVFCRMYHDSTTGKFEYCADSSPERVFDQQFPLYCRLAEATQAEHDSVDDEASDTVQGASPEPAADEKPIWEDGKPMNAAAKKIMGIA